MTTWCENEDWRNDIAELPRIDLAGRRDVVVEFPLRRRDEITIHNYSSIDDRQVFGMIARLVKHIPKSLIPKNGIPEFIISESLFHSYMLMFHRRQISNPEEEEKIFNSYQKNRVWAFSCMDENQRGEVYLALGDRLKRKPAEYSLEHVVFHEIGHHYYFGRGLAVKDDILDVSHEIVANIYANACMLNYIQLNKRLSAFFDRKFDKKKLQLARKMIGDGIKIRDLINKGWSFYITNGVI